MKSDGLIPSFKSPISKRKIAYVRVRLPGLKINLNTNLK